jgi:hypothetical protein
MSFWTIVFLGKRPSGQMSFWANVFLGKSPSGQMSSGQMSFWANVVWANVSEQMSLGKCRMGKRHGTEFAKGAFFPCEIIAFDTFCTCTLQWVHLLSPRQEGPPLL